MARDLGDLIIRLSLDAAQFEEGINKFENQTKRLQKAFTSSTTGMTDFDKVVGKLQGSAQTLTDRLAAQRQKVADLEKAYEESKAAKGADADETKRLGEELDKARNQMDQTARAIELVNEQVRLNSDGFYQFGSNMEVAAKKIEAVGEKMEKAGKMLSTYVTAPLVLMGKGALDAGIEYETAFAGVRKTIDATEEEFDGLSDSIRNMALEVPKTTTELAKIMELGGQMNVPREHLEKFTESIAAMGVATDISEESAALMLAQYMKITNTDYSKIENLGSVIVDLGNNFETTESQILEYGHRVASAGSLAGLSAQEIMGWGTALASTGMEAEAGGTALSKFIINMQVAAETGLDANATFMETGYSLRELQLMADQDSEAFKALAADLDITSAELKDMMGYADDLEAFAKVAGMTAEEFSQAFKEDASGAMQAFIEGLAGIEASGGSVVTALNEMDITEVRYRRALMNLASSTDGLTEALERSDIAYEQNVALQEEASERYGTTASKIQLLKNDANELGIQFSDVMLPTLQKLMEMGHGLLDWLKGLDEGTKENIATVGAFAAALGPVLLIGGKITKSAGSIIETVSKISKKIGEAGGVTASFQNMLSGLMSPLGLVSIAVGLAAASFLSYQTSLRDAREEGKRLADSVMTISEKAAGLTPNLVDVNDMLSQTGQSMSELKTQAAEAETSMNNILSKALTERRELRTGEIAELKDYYSEWARLQEEQLAIYEMREEAILEALRLEVEQGGVTYERLAQYEADYTAAQQATTEMQQEVYYDRIAQVMNYHQTMGTLNTDAYQDDLNKALDWQNKRNAQAEVGNQELYAQQLAVMQQMMNENQHTWEEMGRSVEAFSTTGKSAFETFLMSLTSSSASASFEYKLMVAALEDGNLEMAASFFDAAFRMKAAGGEMTEDSKQTAQLILSCFTGLTGPMGETATEIMRSFVQGQEDMLPDVKDASKMTADEIIEAIRSALDMHSPSRVMIGLGETASQSLVDGLGNKIDAVNSKATELGSAAVKSLETALGPTYKTGQAAIENARKGMSSEGGKVESEASGIGKNLVEGLWSGISSMTSWIGNKISGFVGGVIDVFKKVFGINSPSTLMRDEIGIFLVPGMVDGVVRTGKKLWDAVNGIIPTSFAINPVNWNASGALFRKATILPTINGLQGVGEAGPEAVLPLDTLWAEMSERIKQAMREMRSETNRQNDTSWIKALIAELRGERTVRLSDDSLSTMSAMLGQLLERLSNGETVIMLNDRELGKAIRILQASGAIG